jgi:integrase/recombinase XerD
MSKTPRKTPIRERKGKNLVKDRIAVASAATISLELTFKEALELFVNAKKAEGMRPRTISDYYKHIEWFTRFLSEFYPDVTTIQQLTADIIRNYINYLRDERNPYAGDKTREKDVKGLAANPMEKIEPLRKDSVDNMTGYTEKEIKALFSVLDVRQYSGFRDKIIMLLLLDTGICINELVNVQSSHLDVKRSTLTVPAGIAKNRKSRTIPVSRKVMKLLLELHDENKQYFEPTEFLFLTAYGEQMIPDTFRRRLWKYAQEAGVERATPHKFRHSFARDFLMNGGSVFALQLILDHADIATTRRYVQLEDSHIKEQHQRFSPVSKYLK